MEHADSFFDARDLLIRNARDLLRDLPSPHLIEPGRELRRKMTPWRSARPTDVTLSLTGDGAVWLDVPNKGAGAGVRFEPEEFAVFCSSALSALFELARSHPMTTVEGDAPPG